MEKNKLKPLRYFSTFSGIGGFELGIGPPHTCVGYSEIDKYASSVYQKHFPSYKNYGDIKTIDASKLPDFDLFVGGFPCQAFSIAGLRRGFDDTRGTLFFDIARILRKKLPRLLLLENVKGLLSHDNGRTFKTIISTLTELGYDLQWQVLNSKNFGVPQNRERVFIVGHIRGTRRPEVFPIGQDHQGVHEEEAGVQRAVRTKDKKGQNSQHAHRSVLQDGVYGQLHIGTLRTHKDGKGFREVKSGFSPTIPARAREDGSGQPVIIQRPRGKNKGGSHRIAPTMTGQAYKDNNHVGGVRRLTPTECERLQGFPDSWTAEGVDYNYGIDGSLTGGAYIPMSDTQRYKMLGNAVTVNVIAEVVKRMVL